MRYLLLVLLSTSVLLINSQNTTPVRVESTTTPRTKNQMLPATLFKRKTGIHTINPNFDFDVTCRVKSFEVVYVPRRGDAISYTNYGANFQKNTRHLIGLARPGDRYFFENIKAMCPGDSYGRAIGSIGITIK